VKFILVAKGIDEKTFEDWRKKLNKDWTIFNVDVDVKKITDELVLIKLKDP
jgi:hypothetical protein